MGVGQCNLVSGSPGARRSRGFTLIELLVVAVIMALLMTLILAALSKAQKAARGTYCASNLHQIAVACQGYRVQWNDCIPNNSYTLAENTAAMSFPPPTSALAATNAALHGLYSTSNLSWPDIVAEANGWKGRRSVAGLAATEAPAFRAFTKYFWCPEANPSSYDSGVYDTSYGIPQNLSRGFNRQIKMPDPDQGPLDLLDVRQVNDPSGCVFLGESSFWNFNSDTYNLTNASVANLIKYNLWPMTPKVTHLVNYLFLDGHVTREKQPPHSMGGELGTFMTNNGDTYTMTAASNNTFALHFGWLPGN